MYYNCGREEANEPLKTKRYDIRGETECKCISKHPNTEAEQKAHMKDSAYARYNRPLNMHLYTISTKITSIVVEAATDPSYTRMRL
jgi:hypothetical protein